MVFSSLPFLLLFLLVVLLVSHILPFKFRNFFLLLANLVFYAYGEPVYVLIMIGSILVNYFGGVLIEKQPTRTRKRVVLILGIVIDLAALGVFKYAGLFVGTLKQIPAFSGLPDVSIALPIGISFYTFQAMSYLIDLYRGDVPVQKSLVAFGTYVSLFPQLIAGPIVRMSTVSAELSCRRETADLFSSGIRRFVAGLGKKVLLANNIGAVWTAISQQDVTTLPVLTAWIGLAAFTLQIYFDFSGYSDMAIGLGRMFGFHFLENFNYPYTAVSVTDFWRRWHISLSSWFREYVYIPLGGNRHGALKQLRNLLIVWMLTGIWHGASWNFVVWGLYFGVWLALEKFVLRRWLDKLPRFFQHVYTMLIVMVSWAIFAFDSLSAGVSYLRALVGGFGAGLTNGAGVYTLYTNALLLGILILAATPLPMKLYRRAEQALRARPVLAGAAEALPLLAVGALSVAFLVDASYNPFLYFRF